ncbi:MAG: hypothetical protein WB698_05515 [Solirubrobacteraceae bacterium]
MSGVIPKTLFDKVTTSPFAVSPGPLGSPTGIFSNDIANSGTFWLVAEGPQSGAALYETNLLATPPTVTLRHEYLTGTVVNAVTASEDGDGSVWLLDASAERVERFLSSGTLESFAAPRLLSAFGIAAAPTGAVYFPQVYGTIGEVHPGGEVTERLVEDEFTQFGDVGYSGAAYPIVGPEGALWFTEWQIQRIGRIAEGRLTEFPIPNPHNLPPGSVGGPDPRHIVAGHEGTFWFTDPGDESIGEVAPNGQVHEYPIPRLSNNEPVIPDQIAVAPNGEVWFTEKGAALGSVNPAGVAAPPDKSSQVAKTAAKATGTRRRCQKKRVKGHRKKSRNKGNCLSTRSTRRK